MRIRFVIPIIVALLSSAFILHPLSDHPGIRETSSAADQTEYDVFSTRGEDDIGIGITAPVRIQELERYRETVIHPNGAFYRFSSVDAGSQVLLVEVMDHNWIQSSSETAEIGPDYTYMGGMRMELGDDGSIHGLLWRYENPYYGYYTVLIEIGSEPSDVEISLNYITGIDGQPDEAGISFIPTGEDIGVCFTVENRYYITTMGAEEDHVVSGEFFYFDYYRLIDFCGDGEFIYSILQDAGGILRIMRYDSDLSLMDDRVILTLEDGIGFDNYLYTDFTGDELMVWLYTDHVRDTLFSSVGWLFFGKDGELRADYGDPLIREGERNSMLRPLIRQDTVYYVDDQDLMIYRLRPDGSISPVLNVSSTGLEHHFYSMDVRSSTGQIDVMLEDSDGRRYGFSIFDEDILPNLGSILIDHEVSIIGGDEFYSTSIEITENGLLELDSSSLVINSPFYEVNLINRGVMILRDSKINVKGHGDYGVYPKYDRNEGSMVIENSAIDMRLQNYGDIAIRMETGAEVVDLLESIPYFKNGTIAIHDIEFTGSEDHDRDPYQIRPDYENNFEDPCRLDFINCSFQGVSDLVAGSGYTIGYVGCDFRNTQLISGLFQVDRIEGCTGVNATGFLMNQYGDSWVEDSTFIDGSLLFSTYGNDDGFHISGSDFRGIEQVLVEGGQGSSDSMGVLKYVHISDSDFDGFELALEIDESGAVFVENCSFSEGDVAIDVGHNTDTVDIRNNTFSGNNRSLIMAFHGLPDGSFIVRDNRFIDNNGSILYRGHDDDDVDYFDPYDEEDIMTYYDSDLLDCRYNYFESGSPGKVARTISRDIYFLPYYTLDGRLVSTDDDDLDGMNDGWEKRNGLDPDFYFDRYFDGDKDRFSNYQESLVGSDPNDQDETPGDPIRRKFLLTSIILLLIPLGLVYAFAYYMYARRLNRQLEFKRKLSRYGMRKRSEKSGSVGSVEYRKDTKPVQTGPVENESGVESPPDIEKDGKGEVEE